MENTAVIIKIYIFVHYIIGKKLILNEEEEEEEIHANICEKFCLIYHFKKPTVVTWIFRKVRFHNGNSTIFWLQFSFGGGLWNQETVVI